MHLRGNGSCTTFLLLLRKAIWDYAGSGRRSARLLAAGTRWEGHVLLAAESPLQLRDVQLVHLHEGFGHANDGGGVVAGQQLMQAG